MASDSNDHTPEQWHSEDPAPRQYAPGVRLVGRRRFELDPSRSISDTDVENWLLGDASKTTSALALVERFASQLVQCGLEVHRLTLSVGTLHPQVLGYAWSWSTQDGICDEIQVGEETLHSDEYRKNPMFRVIEHGEVVRIKLPAETSNARSVLMDELAKAGFSEYVALPLSARGEKYNAVTLATRRAGGFDPEQWGTLQRLLDIFALHVERHVVDRIAQNISLTYLGREAGERVVKGTIQRGSGLPIRAVVWSSDMRDFSGLSEQADNQKVADLLNSYFSVLADSVLRHGGDVLKFIGDGMLAVFPLADFESPELAAKAAANAAADAVKELGALNDRMRQAADWKPLRTGIGLHLGEVFFGNIGATKRLDFTVIGEAVNIASRVEGLCKPLEQTVLMSTPVAELIGEGIEALGMHTLKGMQKPEQLFALSGGS